jgi:HlyD family secretion protein
MSIGTNSTTLRPLAVDPAFSKLPNRGRARSSVARHRLRRLIIGAAIPAAVVAILFVFRPVPVDVESGRVTRGPLETTIDAEGTTRVVDRFTIATPVSGRLERITLRAGDAVGPGFVVARLTPMPLDAQASAQARARLAAAQAEAQAADAQRAQAADALAQEERSAARARSLAEVGGISRAERERAELQRAAAEHALRASEARVRRALAEVEDASAALMQLRGGTEGVIAIRSAARGVVLRVHEPSERVAQAGAPLLEIGDLARLEVVVDVLSEDAVRIREGALMRLLAWGGPGELEARVRRVEPAGFTKVSALGVEEQRVNVIGELVGPPPGLGDGYRVDARIVTWQSPDALRVPSAALFRKDDGWSVYVIDGGRARVRSIRIGQRGAAEAEVLAGVEPGDRVILFPSDEIEDGVRVRPLQP